MHIGVKFDGYPPEQLPALAAHADHSGLDELWLVEDLGLAGGIAQVATALALTPRIQVGLGITPAAARNVAYLSMELATLARLHPGRFRPGIGHGEPYWLEQVGAHPGKLLTALRETTMAAQQLLLGETVTTNGFHVCLDHVQLAFPPTRPPLVSLGVRGPRGMELVRQAGTGVILAEGSSPTYVADVRERLGDQRMTVFVWFCVAVEQEDALVAMRPVVAAALRRPGLTAQLGSLAHGELTDHIVRDLTVSGTPHQVAESILRLVDSGADAVILAPPLGREHEQLDLLEQAVLPLLQGRAAERKVWGVPDTPAQTQPTTAATEVDLSRKEPG